VARARRELEPALAAWRGILRGNPVRARQIPRKLIVKPIVMEPLPDVHGYRWQGELNGGAALEGTRRYQSWCRGDGPIMEQWITSPIGRRWNITMTAAA
jgi:hypothetical protein